MLREIRGEEGDKVKVKFLARSARDKAPALPDTPTPSLENKVMGQATGLIFSPTFVEPHLFLAWRKQDT